MKKYFILLAALAVTLSACKGKPTDMSKEGIEEDSLLYSEDAEKRFLEERRRRGHFHQPRVYRRR